MSYPFQTSERELKKLVIRCFESFLMETSPHAIEDGIKMAKWVLSQNSQATPNQVQQFMFEQVKKQYRKAGKTFPHAKPFFSMEHEHEE
jgi:hypothetical protein